MIKKTILLCLVLSLFVLAACTTTVSKLTENDDYVDKKVAIKGEVTAPLKIGSLSGYTLIDKNGDPIIVASDALPAEGDTITARGVLKKGPLGIGYYIETDE